jgi:hypothetical protein
MNHDDPADLCVNVGGREIGLHWLAVEGIESNGLGTQV